MAILFTVVTLIRTRWDRTLSGLNRMAFFFLLINIFQKTPYVFIQIKNVLIYNFTLHIIIVINRNDNIFIMM